MKDDYGAFLDEIDLYVAGAAEGTLAGLTFAVKDVFAIAGQVAGNGHPDWRRTHAVAATTAPAVEAMLDAGATLVGVTVADELCYSLSGENRHYGMPTNPRTADRLPGGSSSGSACAVAGGLTDLALGTDCGGSVRVPASFCGIFGFRPTHGRVSLDGVPPFAPSFDTVGWFAADGARLEDMGRVLLDNRAAVDRPRRLVVATDLWREVNAEVRQALAPALERVERVLGVEARQVTLAPQGIEHWAETFRILQAAQIWTHLGPWVRDVHPNCGPGVARRLEWAATVSADNRATARVEIVERLEECFADDALLCIPTAGLSPRRDSSQKELEAFRASTLRLTCSAGLAGLPQIQLPLAAVNDCPVGLSLIAWRSRDEWLLALGREISSAGRIAG